MTHRDKIRPTIVLVCVICLAFAGYWLLKPRPDTRIIPQQETALGFAFAIDPHLFLTVESGSLNSLETKASEFSLLIRARNTAAGDLKIDLSDLRFAVRDSKNKISEPAAAVWISNDGKALDSELLLPNRQARGEVRLPAPESYESSAVIIWREEKLYKWAPFIRNSVLNTRLRVEMADLIKAAK